MPSLALDAPATYSSDQKRAFAERLGTVYAEVMETELETITVIVHDGGAGTVWRCTAARPVPGALLMCDIRRGRPPEQRRRLCERMLLVCEEVLGIDPATLKIEFTQHAGDEFWREGGLSADWTPSEAGGSPARA